LQRPERELRRVLDAVKRAQREQREPVVSTSAAHTPNERAEAEQIERVTESESSRDPANFPAYVLATREKISPEGFVNSEMTNAGTCSMTDLPRQRANLPSGFIK
jgi:hypothetical protein